ncbi:MAG TPA: hypothetical protein VJV78_27075 [Polyangiales bacterium]|nr:hypothetical protein [Polyangiales bacterium]
MGGSKHGLRGALIAAALALAAISGARAQDRELIESLRVSPAARTPAPAPSGAVAVAVASLKREPARRERTVRVPLRVQGKEEKSRAANFKVTDGDARITTDELGDAAVEIPTQGRTIVSSDEAPETARHSTIAQQGKTALPWLMLDSKETAEGPHVVATRPFVQLARAIVWDPASQRHIVELLFGVDPEPGHEADTDSPLDPPFRAAFSVSCDEVTPAEAEITRVGPAGYNLVRVACSPAVKNENSQQWIEIHVGSGNLRYPFELPHRPGAPLLLASATRVAGFGLGAVTLTVKRVEEDGSPLSAAEPARVQLLAAGGDTLTPNALTIPAGDREASVELRPAGLGNLSVTAVLGDQRSQPLQLQLRWPWFAMLAMLAGASIGAFLSYVRYVRRPPKHIYRRSLANVLSGVLLALASLVLPQVAALPSWARPTELGFLLIAAGAAYLGLDAFDALVRKLFPHVPPKDASSVAK